MALEVWLPLKGSLENKGQDDLTVENYGGVYEISRGRKGQCYSFDGKNHYLQFSKHLDNTNIYKGDFSWAVWLRPSAKHRGGIISEHDASGTFSHVCLEITAELKVRVWWNGNPDISFTNAISNQTWTHVVVTRSENTLKLYINGAESETISQTLDNDVIFPSEACIRIGNDYRSSTTTNSYNGCISDVRIYSNCLTATEVQQIYAETNFIMLNNTIPSVRSIKTGDTLNLPYTGSSKTITLPPGTYLLECWGAQGGYRSSSTYGGKGGYSAGVLSLMEDTILYLYAGGAGSTVTTATSNIYPGGFNGGGYRYKYKGGGGASDIRIGQDSLYARVIVAGGGGSDGATNKAGGVGGGATGTRGTFGYGSYGYGGTEKASTSTGGLGYISSQGTTNTEANCAAGFGFGGFGYYVSSGYGGAGGGGWYGGEGVKPDGSGDDDGGGGGGSGYVYTSNSAANYPSGCLLNNSYYLSATKMIDGSNKFLSYAGNLETGQSGNGAIRIVVLQAYTLVDIPTLTNKTYNGSVQSPGESGYDLVSMEKIGTTSAILPGTYTIVYRLKEGYMWSDKTLEAKTIQWSITSPFKKLQSKIYNSSFSNYTPQFFNGTDFTKYDVWIYGA